VTLFEYIAIAYSMLGSFAALRALSGIPHAIQDGKRYWVHLTWLFATLGTVLLSFWAFWWSRDVLWNIVSFVTVLASPGIGYVFVSLLVPENPETVDSWRDHFYAVRLRLFLIAIAWDIMTFLGAALRPDHSPSVAVFGSLIAIHLTGAISREPRVQALLAGTIPVVVAAIELAFFFQPAQ
jgi:hypothetical protein